jgi:hypothetical protein
MKTALRTHSGLAELAIAVVLYGLYEVIRGFGSTTLAAARAHTADIVAFERHLGFFVERSVQVGVDRLPAVPMLLGFAYMSLHFGATAAVMFWTHRRHRERFAIVRTTLVVSTAVSLAIYILFPAAPPRLAGLGFADTVTEKAGINMSSDALGSLYNPFAAVPSLHFGYALLVGVTVAVLARRRWVRLLGAAYPPFMLFTIVATGNHFFLDAVAGGIVMVAGYLVARFLVGARELGRPRERTLRCVEESPAEDPAELVPAADLPTRLAA